MISLARFILVVVMIFAALDGDFVRTWSCVAAVVLCSWSIRARRERAAHFARNERIRERMESMMLAAKAFRQEGV